MARKKREKALGQEDAFKAGIGTTPDDRLKRLVYADWLDEQGRTTEALEVRLNAEAEEKNISVEQVLLNMVAANPGGNEPRLVYANWLEKNGQPERAEYIRTATKIDSMRGTKQRDGRTYDALCKHAHDLLHEHGTNWFDQSHEYNDPIINRRLTFKILLSRGFPATLELGGHNHLNRGISRESAKHTTGILQRNPTIDQLNIVDCSPEYCEELAAGDSLKQVDDLEITFGTKQVNTPYSYDEIAHSIYALLSAPSLNRLTELEVTSPLDLQEWANLIENAPPAAAERLKKLDNLWLESQNEDTRAKPDDARRVFGHPNLANLKLLDLNNYPISDDGLQALLDARMDTPLQSLGLKNAWLSDAGADIIVNHPTAKHLQDLLLNNNPDMTPDSVATFADALRDRKLVALEELSLRENDCPKPLQNRLKRALKNNITQIE